MKILMRDRYLAEADNGEADGVHGTISSNGKEWWGQPAAP